MIYSPFAQVLDETGFQGAQQFDAPLFLVRAVCLLQRKKPSSNAYWTRWNQFTPSPGKFHLQPSPGDKPH